MTSHKGLRDSASMEQRQGARQSAPPSTEPARGVMESTMEDAATRACARRTAAAAAAPRMLLAFDAQTGFRQTRLAAR